MERVLCTVILNDGLPLDVCEQVEEMGDPATGEVVLVPGLKVIRVAGGRMSAPAAHALLKAHGRVDVIEQFNIPAW